LYFLGGFLYLVGSFLILSIVKSVLKKNLPFKSYGKNSGLSLQKFLIKMPILALQKYVCYEVILMCYNRNPNFYQANLNYLYRRYIRFRVDS
jgi:hypothetical protein